MPRGGRRKGALTYKHDEVVVPGLAMLCFRMKRDRRQNYFTTIRWFVDSAGPGAVGVRDRLPHELYLGRTRNAAVKRLHEKVMRCDWRAHFRRLPFMYDLEQQIKLHLPDDPPHDPAMPAVVAQLLNLNKGKK
jgi:hypothetical protein